MKVDGTLECLGRLSDGQVKLRGQRIELGEIEHAALRTPGCHDSRASVVDSQLILFCAADQGICVDDVQSNCMSWLPQFMVPNEIIIMKQFPRLPSGKVDAKKLRDEFVQRKSTDTSANGDLDISNQQDREVVNIISEIVGRPVKLGTVLSSAGLDSLSAIRLASIFRQLGFKISATSLLKYRTVGDVCINLRQPIERLQTLYDKSTQRINFESTIKQHPLLVDLSHLIERATECTWLQSAMLAETQRTPDMYCNEMLFETSSGVSPQNLYDAFERVIESNEILRTGFVLWEGQSVAVVFSSRFNNQITLQSEYQHAFNFREPVDFLQPFRVHIMARGENLSPTVLIHAHHAIYDGWSMDMILSDVSSVVEGNTLAARPQFKHVLDCQEHIGKASEDASRAFWSSNLLGWNKASAPKLMGRTPQNQILSFETFFNISPESVQEISISHEVSNQAVFQAALAIAWQGVVGSPDILLGSVVSGRTIPVDDIEHIIGPCIASMPLRVDTSNMNAITDVLKGIHSNNRAAMEYGNLPLSDICKLANLTQTESLYDVLFVYQQSLYEPQMQHSIFKAVRHKDKLETKLLVEVEPQKNGYAVQMTYHTAFLSPDFVTMLAQQVQELCRQIISDPTRPLAALRRIENVHLSIYSEQIAIEDEPADMNALLNASFARNPDAEALRFVSYDLDQILQTTTLTYSDLSDRANKIAHHIRNSGVQEGEIIAIIMKKSASLYVSILATIKAGCAYLPILPATPPERMHEMLRQSRTRYCIVDDEAVHTSTLSGTITFLNIASAPLDSLPSHTPIVRPDPQRLAYVIFTSGTTGVPKGVAISQRSLASNIAYLESVYPKSSQCPRLLQACSHAFDVSVFEIFYAWYAGMSLCAAENDVIFGDLERWTRDLQITHLSLTPTVAALVDPENVPKVEFLVTAGEPMTSLVLDRWGSLLFQGYGPSETTNICSVKQMSTSDNIEHLGWVFPNTSVYVMAPGSQDVLPRGWVGEFCFGGSQVANGYINNKSLTAEKFIRHHLFGRIYRSGDMGRMLPDGSLIIIGRLDDQLKLRGQRIEAEEINRVLTDTELVAGAVTVLAQSKIGRSDQLVTFYKPLEGARSLGPIEISPKRNHMLFATLRSKLSSYMIPSYLIPASHIPMTSSGKVDRRQLLQWFDALSTPYLETASIILRQPNDVGDWTGIDCRIAEAIVESMKVPQSEIGRWTPFLALGIDSISAISLAKSLSRQVEFEVPISAILQNPTVAQLGHYLSTISDRRSAQIHTKTQLSIEAFETEVSGIVQGQLDNVEAILPCMPLQEAMLLQGQESYYNRILLRLQVSPADMQSYWRQMSKRHDILRTCFVTTMRASHPIAQVVLREWELPWRTFEVTVPSLEGASREHLDSLPDPLDSMSPPCSLGIIRYKGLNFLSFICHHALYDGIAMENIWREVEALARGRTLQDAVPYKPFLQQALSLPADVETFWQDHFRGFRESATFARSARSSFNQSTNTVSIDMSFKEIQQRTRSIGVSLLSLFQASWAAVLACVYDEPDVVFGNVVSGRTLGVEGVDKLVAPCFNTIPLRMDTSQSVQNVDLVKAFQRLNSILLPYQFSPLKLVRKVIGVRRRPLFDTLLLLQQPLKEMDKNIWTLEEDCGNMDVPVVCEVVPCPNLNSVVVNLHYDMDMITADLATTISDMFKFMTRSILTFPFRPISNRSIIPTAFSQSLTGLVLKKDKREDLDQHAAATGRWSNLEMVVRKAFANISGLSETAIRRETTIFQLGLDSINAVQVASSLRAQGHSVLSSDVIECSSCMKLASRINQNSEKLNRKNVHTDFTIFQKQVKSQVEKSVPFSSEIETILPCTALQNGMLVAFKDPEEGQYLNSLSLMIQAPVDTDLLICTWKQLQEQHPMLRTGFVHVSSAESTFAMVRHKTTRLAHPITTFKASSSASFDLEDWKTEWKAFILENLHEPPWRVALVDDGERTSMHVLIHHALYDAQSLDGLLGGLSDLVEGKPCTFPRIEPVLAEILSREQEKALESKEFWESQASRAVVNSFPTMTPLREQSGEIIVREQMSSIAFGELQDAVQAIGVSVQSVLQASWARILASYLGERSVVFGIALAGRTTDLTENAPFPCITTVPIIAEAKESNMQLIKCMMEYNTSVHKYQFAPLAQIQKWMGYPGTPVFDTILVYQKKGSSHLCNQQWKLVADHPSVGYTVSLEVESDENDRLCLRLTTRSNIVPHQQARLLLSQFDAVLYHLLRQPNATENDLYQSQPNLFSITPAQIPTIETPVKFVHQFVERNADLQPDSPALEFVFDFSKTPGSKRMWTYKQLDGLGNQVAHLLSKVTGIGSIVAIHFPKCPEAYFSILGILKAGCAFLALDPNAPVSRKEFILADSKAACLLTSKHSDVSFVDGTPVIAIQEEDLWSYPTSRILHTDEFTPNNTCYCLYTSGTTGTPKGCEITHENTVQAMMAFQHLFQGHWQRDSRWLQFAALHFDVSVLEQYWTWSVGITVVAAPKDLILDDLVGSINKMGITHIDLTPSLARLTHPDQLPNLCKGVFITGGEQLNQEILDAWGPKAVIYNAYGPTEATIGVTMYPRVPINGRPSNIGRQFPNVGSYVFHSGTDIPVLRGGVGELCVSGKLVGKGYLHRPELTNERFPNAAQFGERIYRTGDLVRMLYDGCFDFLGRADDQVKLRGQRLEIGEINHIIRSKTRGVQDAATLVLRHRNKDVLVAFLVGDGERPLELYAVADGDALGPKSRKTCVDNLPGYMVPTYFIRLSYIPLSPNNKVEAKELKTLFQNLHPDELMQLTGRESASLGSHVDTTVIRAISRALTDFSGMPTSQITPSTSIFDCGVDSISALQLSAMLKDRGFPTASPAMLLRNPIVSDLAESISRPVESTKTHDDKQEIKQSLRAFQHKHRAFVCRELRMKPDDIEYIAPCSPLQAGMLSAAVAEEDSTSYFNWFDLSIKDGVPIEDVRRCWQRTIENNSILRSVFVKSTDGYLQVALHRVDNVWHSLVGNDENSVGDILENRRLSWVRANSTSHALSPLQLIHIDGPNNRKIRLHIFHGLYDGNSFELMNHYASCIYQDGIPPSGPSFLEAMSHGPLRSFEFCRPFWTAHLQNWRQCELPKARPSNTNNTGILSSSSCLPVEPLENLRRQQNVTLQSVVLSIWTMVLQKYISSSLTTGIIVAGRSLDLPHVENTIGPLFNTVPFFNDSFNGLSWGMLVRRCHEFNTDILPFQHVPLRDIQKWCSGGRSLFDNLFTFQLENSESALDNLPWTITTQDPNSVGYALAFEATRTRDEQLRLHIVARSDVADYGILQQMLGHFEQVVSTVKADTIIDTSTGSQLSLGAVVGSEAASSVNFSARGTLPWTPISRVIRDELCAFVNVPPEETFPDTAMLDLGIDSIDAIKISARLARRNIKVSASQIMRHQTISGIGSVAKTSGTEDSPKLLGDSSCVDLQSRLHLLVKTRGVDMDNIEHVLPPTALQEAMVARMIQSDFEWYFNHDILKLDPDVSLDQLKEAWSKLIRASPILRTAFVEIDDCELDMSYCQVVHRQAAVPIIMDELSEFSSVHELISTTTETARRDQGRSGLFQVILVPIAGQNYMILSMAHALYDGWSLALIYDDLQTAYESDLTPRKYDEVLVSQQFLRGTSDYGGFWETYLAKASPTVFEAKESAPATSSSDISRVEMPCSKSLAKITRFCKKKSISLQAICLACWTAVAAHLTHSLDILFGVVLSGRDFEGSDDLMFPCMNTVAFRSILHDTASGFLKYIEANLADVREHQRVPLRKAQAAARLGGRELFNSLFILQKAPSTNTTKAMWGSVDGTSAVEYPVCVEVEAVQDQLHWRLACKAEYFTENDSKGILDKLDQVLGYILTYPDAEILSFGGNNVSICGLPRGAMTERAVDNRTSDAALYEDQNTAYSWSKIGILIRQVLSDVSSMPVESILPTATLFHLGLDSISAIKVSLLLRKVDIDIKPRYLIEANCIEEIVHLAEEDPVSQRIVPDEVSQWTMPPAISRNDLIKSCKLSEEDIQTVIPATSLQVHMLSAWQNSGGSVFYPKFCYEITGGHTGIQLVEAWERVVGKVPILRTLLISTGDTELPWVQVILSPDATRKNSTGLLLWNLSVSESECPGTWSIQLNIHHSLYDGFSLPKLMQLYHEELFNKARDAGSSGLDITSWQNYSIHPLLPENIESRQQFWVEYLTGSLSHHRKPTKSEAKIPYSTQRVSYLRKEASSYAEDLRKLASMHGITLQSLFLAACARTLLVNESTQNSTRSVILGVYLANRNTEHDDLDATYPTLNLVPLRVNFDPVETLTGVAVAIQKDLRLLQSSGRARVGLWEIYKWTGIRITTFVNFLSLLDDNDEPEGVGLLRNMAGDELSASDSEILNQPWLHNNVVREAYPVSSPTSKTFYFVSLLNGISQVSLDIEASVHNGSLDIGIFASTDRLSQDDAPRIVDGIVEHLGSIE